MRNDDTVPRRLTDRSLVRVFTMGVTAPVFLTQPAAKLAPLHRDEILRRAWGSVGLHLTRSLSRVDGRRG